MNYKKVIFKIMIGIVGIFALYFGIHTYANGQLMKTYAKGFEQNPLGDYAKNESDMVLTVYEAPLFQTYTNLSVSNSKEKVDLIVWVPLYSKELSYGLIVKDDENIATYQIEVNDHLQTDDEKYKHILQKKQNAINEIKSVVEKEWGLNF
ncbi:hypothetical protein CX649_07465 [Bacillaceae bacterium ZC4]|nr:hypothetical protein CX649_07465 [Bacillaceae bacterium ZC4]MDR9792098.1 hypothetical protein [Aeribacillus pallidus]